MALFGRKKTEEDFARPGLPPMAADLRPPSYRDLTSRGIPSVDVLADAEAAELRPMPPYPRPSAPAGFMPVGMPPPPTFRAPPPKTITAEIEEVSEAIVAEKWEKASKEIDS